MQTYNQQITTLSPTETRDDSSSDSDLSETSLESTASEPENNKFTQAMRGLFLIAGPAGIIYGMVMLAKLIHTHFQNAKKDDLAVGNPFCWDKSDTSAIAGLIGCASTYCSTLKTPADAANWVSNHPIDLAGINANDVFTQCQVYTSQCASSSGFTTPFNAGQDSAFDLNCDHTWTKVGEGFSWLGYAVLSIMALAASAGMLVRAHHHVSNLFRPCNENNPNENNLMDYQQAV